MTNNKLAAHMMVQRPYQIINVQNELCVTDGSNTWRSEGIGSKDKRLPNPIKWTTLFLSKIGSIFFTYKLGFASFMTSVSLTYRRIEVKTIMNYKKIFLQCTFCNFTQNRDQLLTRLPITSKSSDCSSTGRSFTIRISDFK